MKQYSFSKINVCIFVILNMIINMPGILALADCTPSYKTFENQIISPNEKTSKQINIEIIPIHVSYLNTNSDIFRIYNFETPKKIELYIIVNNPGVTDLKNIQIKLIGDSIQKIDDYFQIQILRSGENFNGKISFIVNHDSWQKITINATWSNGNGWSQEIMIYPLLNINSYIGRQDILNIQFSNVNYLQKFKQIPGFENVNLISRTFHKDYPDYDWLVINSNENYNTFSTKILAKKEVKWIEPHLIPKSTAYIGGAQPGSQYISNDPDYVNQWGLDAINIKNAWGYRLGRSSIILAIIDSGILLNNGNPSHQDLSYGGIQGCDETVGNGCQNKQTIYPQDDQGHGTGVTSIAAGQIDNSIGMAGVANLSYMPIKVLVNRGNQALFPLEWATEATISTHVSYAVKYAYEHGAKIISMSLVTGTSRGYETTLENEINLAYNNYGCVIVAASGNDNAEIRTFPAGFDNVVSVGAVQKSGSTYPRWQAAPQGSNYGDYLDIVAPGAGIYMASIIQGNPYTSGSGTSMATPFVSGTAALMWAVNPSLSNGDIIGLLQSTAKSTGAADDPSGWDKKYGYGLLDAGAAIAAAYNQMSPISGSVRLTNALRASNDPSVKISGNTIYMVWTDYRDYTDGSNEIYLMKLDQNGNKIAFSPGVYEQRLTNLALSVKLHPAIDIGPDGDIWVIWFAEYNNGPYYLVYQRYSPSGIRRLPTDITLNIPQLFDIYDTISFYVYGTIGSETARLIIPTGYQGYCNLFYYKIDRNGNVVYSNLIGKAYSGQNSCQDMILHAIIKPDVSTPGSYNHITFLNYSFTDSGKLAYRIEHWRTDSNGGTACSPQCYKHIVTPLTYLESYNLIYDVGIDSYNDANFVFYGFHGIKYKWCFMYVRSGLTYPQSELEIDTENLPPNTYPVNWDVHWNLNLVIDNNNLIHYFTVTHDNQIVYREIGRTGTSNITAILRSNRFTSAGYSPVGVIGTTLGKFMVFWCDNRIGGNSEIYFAMDATYWVQSETQLSSSLESYNPVTLGDWNGNIENVWIEHDSSLNTYTIKYKQILSNNNIISNNIPTSCINNNLYKYNLHADYNYFPATPSGTLRIFLTWIQISSSISHIWFAGISPVSTDGGTAGCVYSEHNFGYNDAHNEGNPDIAAGQQDVYVVYERNMGTIGGGCPYNGPSPPINYDISLSIYRFGGTPDNRKGITIANDPCPQSSPKIKTDSRNLRYDEEDLGTTIPKLYITYINKTNDPSHGIGEVYYQSFKVDTGQLYSTPKRITQYTTGAVYSVNLLMDPYINSNSGILSNFYKGQAYSMGTFGFKMNLFWSQQIGSTTNLFYTRVNPADGSTPRDYDSQQLRSIITGLQYIPYGIVISSDSSGRFFIAFYLNSLTDQDLGIIRVDTWGSTFENLRYLGIQSGSLVRTNPSITTDNYGQIFISWEQNTGSASRIWYTNTIIRNNYGS